VALVLGDLELHAARLAEAKRAYARALELTPSAAQAQEAHAGVGVVELRAGHAALARAAFERALAAAPDGPRAGELERRLSAP
jgi:Tfp pilus assembly protein PilF